MSVEIDTAVQPAGVHVAGKYKDFPGQTVQFGFGLWAHRACIQIYMQMRISAAGRFAALECIRSIAAQEH